MKDCLKVIKIVKDKNRIEYEYEKSGKWKEVLTEEKMFIEYGMNIEEVPDSLAIVPFICNVLPISWYFDLEICVETIDKSFLECIPKVKEGYIKMYPQVNLKGNLKANNIQENNYLAKNVGALFSGGVDALSTLVQHLDEKPDLLTVWGADLKLDDKIGWDRVDKHSKFVANHYELGYIYAKANMKTFLNENNLVRHMEEDKIEGSWWHEFQHGIGILGLFSPIAYLKKYKNIYIASSFPAKFLGKYTCASDPTIDNNLCFGNCKIIHDGCEFNRQQKIKNICNHFQEKGESPIPVRVCWISEGGDNCCECDKCYRTILGIIAEKEDPRKLGFNLTNEKAEKMIKRLPKMYNVKYDFHNHYSEIQNAFIENYKREETPKELIWFRDFKFKKEPKYRILIRKLKKYIKRKIVRVLK